MTAPRRSPSTRYRAWQVCSVFIDNMLPQKWQVCRKLWTREPATIRSHPDHFIAATVFNIRPPGWKLPRMEVRFGDNNNPPESCTPLVWRGATSAEPRKYHCLGYSPSLSSLPPWSGAGLRSLFVEFRIGQPNWSADSSWLQSSSPLG